MFIDPELCLECLDCRPVCPMGAIRLDGRTVFIDLEDCVECGVCLRFGICPEGAIKQVEAIPYPRILRAIFSDPVQRHESTGIQGRGTEEMKTNDVTGLFQPGWTGFSIELGRPGLGAYLSDLEKVLKKITAFGVTLAPGNPVLQLIDQPETGALRPEVLGEKVLSAIVELLLPQERVPDFLDEILDFLDRELETVATVSLICRADGHGDPDLPPRLRDRGPAWYPNGKVNLGLARR